MVSFPYGPMPTQPLGWFKKPITKAADFKGLKFRTVGISIDLFTAMGAAVNALPGGEIVPAMDRGLLDAAEFNNATSDRLLGFPDVSKVCMLQSYHQNAEQFEIMFNKTKYDALPAKMKAIIANAVEAASADMSWKAIDRYSKDYIELQTKDKVKFYKTPDSILQEQLEALGRRWSTKKSADNPLFKEIVAVAKGIRRARGEMGPGHHTSAGAWPMNHYFGAKKPAAEEGLRHIVRSKHHPAASGWLFFWMAPEPAKWHQLRPRHVHEIDAETASVDRQDQHLRRPGVFLADRRADPADLLGGVLALRARPSRTPGPSTS